MSFLSATALLFLVIDPLGNIPVFLSVLKNIDQRRQRVVILRELVIALGVLIAFLFAGRFILSILRVSESSLGIAGGIILFLIAMRMIFSGEETVFPGRYEGEPLIVPLAVPLIAGPSAMTTVMLLIAREPSRWFE
jgi:small neutral amino acid transporter SnatA (MarC family)